PKNKNPKKDVGSRTLLYSDRCVMCSRCVRFCDEVAGTGELGIINRGSRAEIDVFPGVPLENDLQGNVVDICPVGSLLDKDFLMDQRVWFLKSVDSVCNGCAVGCAIHVDHNKNQVWRLKPRYNPGVNDWWMCDEGRFGFKYVNDANRLTGLKVRRGVEAQAAEWTALDEVARLRLGRVVEEKGAGSIACMLSPFMSCEEAWLLATFIRSIDDKAALVMGPVPLEGDDRNFPVNANGATPKFTILSEKAPNRRGIEMILEALGGDRPTLEDFLAKAGKGGYGAAWFVGGYPKEWVTKEIAAAGDKTPVTLVQDILPSKLTDGADVVIASCAWVERSGCFVNHQGKIQPFESAINPPDGCQRDGNYLFQLTGESGLYNAAQVRDRMAASIPAFGQLHVAPAPPAHAH
ncbi:MAG: molybdopterin-dependent oxidoreductase, partial [Phycisphaerales bacterium]|nr:molybdopterin-dependent oxidoreductase [Phycisphaerales bacterium]